MNSTHPSPARGVSQCDLILAYLTDHAGEWVEMPKLVQVSGGYAVHSRIADLRRRGHIIAHKNEHAEDGAVHSFYKLEALATEPFRLEP